MAVLSVVEAGAGVAVVVVVVVAGVAGVAVTVEVADLFSAGLAAVAAAAREFNFLPDLQSGIGGDIVSFADFCHGGIESACDQPEGIAALNGINAVGRIFGLGGFSCFSRGCSFRG